MIICLERLRLLRVENRAGDDKIEAPQDWGIIPSYYDDLVNNMSNVFSTNPLTKKEAPGLQEEFNERCNSLNAVGPVVPGSMFLVPTENLLNNDNLNLWFPALDNNFDFAELCPSSLPFD